MKTQCRVYPASKVAGVVIRQGGKVPDKTLRFELPQPWGVVFKRLRHEYPKASLVPLR